MKPMEHPRISKLDIEDEIRMAEEAAAAARARVGDVDAIRRAAEDAREELRKAAEAEALGDALTSIELARSATIGRLEAHRATGCTRRPCEECWIARCIGCGVDVSYDDLPSDTRTAVRAAAPGDRVPTSCEKCRPSEERSLLLHDARISVPPRFRDTRWDVPGLHGRVLHGNGGDEIARVRMLVDDPIVTIVGRPKAGKTTLLACMFNEVVDRGAYLEAPSYLVARAAGAFWIHAMTLNNAKANHPLGQRRDAPEIERAKRATLLVIDDVGAELGERQLEGVKEVVLERFDHQRPTWISVGVSGKALGVAYGGGFARRIGSEGEIVKLGPPPGDGDGKGRTEP